MKKFASTLIAAILLAIPSFCGAVDLQAPQPEMAAKIQALREEVKAQGGTYEVAYSAAMDIGIESLAGLKVPPGWNKSDAPSVPMLGSTVQTLPASYDWRTLNGVTPIKNQGNCGSCWAFSTVGPLESQILLQGGGTVPLSEQYLLSCNTSGWSCNGGWFAHDYHMDLSGQDNKGPGAVLTSSDPYTGTDATCGGPYSHPYKLTSWAYIGSEDAVPSTDAIKQAIYTYGPVSVAVCAGSHFQAYSGGVFNTNESCGSSVINHAVVLVGWNDNNGTDGYWILRNSWGTSWGLAGYMYIGYGVSQVGYGANFIEYAGGTPNPAPASVSVPGVVGETQAAATTAITGDGLVVGTVTTQSSATVASGTVISQNPAAGVSVASGSAVNLVVSSGPAPPVIAPVSVPSVVGDTQTAATTVITGDKLVVGTVTTQSSATASGTVIGQSPAAATSVASGSAVNLTVSSGSAPPVPPVVAEPDLTGVFSNLQTSNSGKVVTGNFEVENIGNAATANSFRVLIYLSKNGVTRSTLLGSATISTPIQPGAYVNLSIHESSRKSFRGEYLIAVVDPDDLVPDSNRNNNVVASNVMQTSPKEKRQKASHKFQEFSAF